ncbi:MAG: hypothetical protein P1U91_08780 [Pseudophaeobacter sp. bin_em_oilr2.035]|uniref:Dihydroorotate dehydrogenase n=1 Tax=Phaeobacter gallaeciensis TaxID=60890 RepID=A0ABD4XCN8_9RHOB|nr:hypothetical protein [Phaeobacter gallaeciensis]MDF1772037.1 hypothetical protein [Pseudophaeobacter sp. bin_em_oilr2.035]MDE4146088.1 hypothetical protein [Phaeobacter gallaeciensis]MDE4158761.1 hypothetical protein [Phaeobacter gallaeciensis]MDE4162938.1 hypothetical protein [Phaeobacter gallaeciensis]MDE4167166.1 hypothetical protein [Phaeobacter gallaeciensis]
MADTEKDIDLLEALLEEARQDQPTLPDDLSARILADAADAADVQARQAAALAVPPAQNLAAAFAASAIGMWRQFRAAVGGWPAMGGMAAACAVGLWIGLAPPSFLPDPAEFTQLSVDTTALPYDSYDLAVMLGEETE